MSRTAESRRHPMREHSQWALRGVGAIVRESTHVRFVRTGVPRRSGAIDAIGSKPLNPSTFLRTGSATTYT
jgi:hypothetical protein